MNNNPEISVIVTTFERPQHLRRCLASLDVQQNVAGRFEVIVTDDGSRDRTETIVAEFASQVDFRVEFVTGLHTGFHVARCRNRGIHLARAPYLLFVDGDCVLPPDHVEKHLKARRPGVVQAGNCIRLDKETTDWLDEGKVRDGVFVDRVGGLQKWQLLSKHLKAMFHQSLGSRRRPNLIGFDFAAWRSQLLQINGFDEQFRGWGCEDDDLRMRLCRIGARIHSVVGNTYGYHLWHPPHPTTPASWNEILNVPYMQRPLRRMARRFR